MTSLTTSSFLLLLLLLSLLTSNANKYRFGSYQHGRYQGRKFRDMNPRHGDHEEEDKKDPDQNSTPAPPDARGHFEVFCKDRTGTNCTLKAEFREVVHRQEAFVVGREDEFAIQSAQWTRNVYPPKPVTMKALKRFQELPYPILGGTSPYFFVLIMSVISFYFGKLLGLLLRKTVKKIELNPDLQEFPPMFIYSLQQTKREAKVMREVRNTWAWLSRRYVVREEDEKLDLRLFQTTWSDFEVPKDIWGVVRNALAVSSVTRALHSALGQFHQGKSGLLDRKSGPEGGKTDNDKDDGVKRVSLWLDEVEKKEAKK